MNTAPLVIAAFVFMVLGIPALVGAVRARFLEESIFLRRLTDRAVAEYDLECYEREMGER